MLFSVLISSLLLTIGLSIFSIALKELSISTASRQSVYAFYAADSGRECAFYWDISRNGGRIPNLFDNDKVTGEAIYCGNSILNPMYIKGSAEYPETALTTTSHIPNFGSTLETISVKNDTEGPNFKVTIIKSIEYRGTADAVLHSTIISDGRDSTGGDRVERSIEQNY